MNQYQLLLLKDVHKLGRKGDVVRAKPGYARNFLLPTQKAVVADRATMRLKEKIRKEREEQAAQDKKEAEELASIVNGKSVVIEAKVDPDGTMYGSVKPADIAAEFAKQNITLDKSYVTLVKPIKKLGTHSISLHLKEGVLASCTLTIVAEGEKSSESQEQTHAPSTR